VILLDTNHVTILRMPSNERRTRLVERMTLSHLQQFGIPIVAVEETMRGWMAVIAKERLARRQVTAFNPSCRFTLWPPLPRRFLEAPRRAGEARRHRLGRR
jgi:hypothetical protein